MTQSLLRGASIAALVVLLAGCGHKAPPAPVAPEVGVVTANASSIPIVYSYPGRLAATLTAQVRARVTGIVLQRVYKEGTDVKAGDVLFKIDPAPLQASLRQAEAQLAQAQASAHNATLTAKRSRQLGATGVLSRQDVDNAIAAAAEASAAVKAARATVANAKINLGYATVTAPISGRAGRANVTQGALVSPTDVNPLTTVQVIDPIYANFSEPMAEVERLRAAEKGGQLKLAAPNRAEVQIVLPDGTVYSHQGTLDFTDLAVDPATGAVDLRAVIPNPDHALLPGMFVKVRLTLATLHNAFLLPQSAIQRDNDGAYVYVVGSSDKIEEKRVKLGAQRGGDWIVLSGLDAGARVVASGIQKARAGEKVTPVAYKEAGNGDG
ncbi:MAG TPA: efflux RND transporter periplasmic adaptor subunit [Rhodanobacteraceae bacterium]|jgi:membrane fusion protein (multidrug efflux system)|nr:efflux RND transporter periplasmic adaptor subunit [Rhodanobacteraceae bacterium]